LETTIATDAKQAFEELREWTWPERGPEAEKASFNYQTQQFVKGEEPCYEMRAMLIKRVVAAYPSSRPRSWTDESVDEVVRSIMSVDVKEDSSPGVPLCMLAATNKILLRDHFGMVCEAVKERLSLLATMEPEDVR